SVSVGKPTAFLLLQRHATVTICHIWTKDLAHYTQQADILVVAAGKPGLIKGEMVKEGAVVIDVGINRVGDRVVGDVDFEEVKEKASLITPVPGGVGPLTVAMLLKNTVLACKRSLGVSVCPAPPPS
ncbi:MAG: bifunctional methylenetetrahydrofolate dehydrogenase/methenyltetrahydrofolate cyclohydrolase, partial [Candidatus Methylomirabilales bacterium]